MRGYIFLTIFGDCCNGSNLFGCELNNVNMVCWTADTNSAHNIEKVRSGSNIFPSSRQALWDTITDERREVERAATASVNV